MKENEGRRVSIIVKRQKSDSWSWLLIVLVVAVLLLLFFVLFHIVLTPNGPTRMVLIPKKYPSFRLTVVYLPGWVSSLEERSFLWTAQWKEDPLVEHLLASLDAHGSLERAVRR